jgi:ABC-type transport system involved in cytochrome bd biosynthesis fused ATPase/permease subunit
LVWRTSLTLYLQVRYRPELEPVLRGVTFEVKPRQKVGVVGRTGEFRTVVFALDSHLSRALTAGSGKSSLMLALFRILEAESGYISIDGLTTSQVGLDDLRSRLAIIPQVSVLHHGYVFLMRCLDRILLYLAARCDITWILLECTQRVRCGTHLNAYR